MQPTSIHCLIRAGLPGHITASESHGAHPCYEAWRDQRRSVPPLPSTLTNVLTEKRTPQPARWSCRQCLRGIAALQVVHEAELLPSPSPIENTTSLRNITSYKVFELHLKYHMGVPNMWFTASLVTIIEMGCQSGLSPCLHIAHPKHAQQHCEEDRTLHTEGFFPVILEVIKMMVALAPLCFTSTLVIHTKLGHCRAAVADYSACASLCSVSPFSPIRTSKVHPRPCISQEM